ncbi:MAG TPA: hypothetical protein VIJ42_14225 [Stellaceae bacterium]
MIMRTVALLAMLLNLGLGAAAAAGGPFAQPVTDCHPCRFSPGKGQSDFNLTFVFTGTGDQRTLTAFDIAPVSGDKTQRLATGDIAVSGFADGFTIDDSDMNFDGLGDLSIVTGEFAAGNADARYWIYEPATRRFVPLERAGAGDADSDDRALQPTANHELYSHIHDTNATWEDYWYRISGHRAVAVRKEEQHQDGELMMRTVYDLTVEPPRIVSRHTIGYVGDSPARREFDTLLDAQSRKAAALYRKGAAKQAAAAMEFLIGTVELPYLVDSYPVQGDDSRDRKIVGQFNDYGFYLAEAGRPKDAIAVLSAVVDVEADRIVAYLNLADAYYAAGDKAAARTNYAEYRKRMAAAGKAAKMPPRVTERLR